jgi:DNA-binding LytR/AlgR family response regulator
VKILPEEVLWVAVSGNHYCEVVTSGRKAQVRASLSEMHKQLTAFPFVRVHRSYLVNASHIESINEQDQTLMVAGHEVPIGVSYREGLMRFVRKI